MYRISGLFQRALFIKKKPSGMMALETNYLLVKLATSMVSGFGVLFIYGLGNSFKSSLLWVGAFFIAQRLVVAGSLHKLALLVQRIGYRKMMMVSVAGMAFKLWLLSLSGPETYGYLTGALLFGGLSLSGYTIVFHGMFLDDNDDEKIGAQMGMITMLGRVAGIISPLFAGLLIERLGFPVMFLVAMVMLLLSSIPLWMMPKHKHKKNSYSLIKVGKMLKKYRLFCWSAFFWYITDAVQWLIWPIYMYLILKSYSVFGAVGSLVMILNISSYHVVVDLVS